MIDFHFKHSSASLASLLARANLNPAGLIHLKNAYGGHDRAYHGLFHIAFLWYCHTELAGNVPEITIQDWQQIADAIACHDVVYDAHLKTNEIESAIWWRQHAQQSKTIYRMPMKLDWTAMAIEASSNHFVVRPMVTHDDMLLQWFLGLDLILLAAPWPMFDMNQLMIRAEYAHLSQTEWDTGRKAFLTGTVGKTIYQHPYLNSLFEATAKANIERSLAEIG